MRDEDTVDPLTGARPLAEGQARELLRAVRRLAETPRSVVAFDLDSTLLDNRPRQALILREYGESIGDARLARSRPDEWTGWDEGIPMRRVGLDDAEIERHREPFKAFWRARFFTSEYCRLDCDVAGAVDFVRDIATVARVVYLTGRHEPMRAGSVESFVTLGFPLPEDGGVHLIMKPTLEESDDAFKARAYDELKDMGVVVAAFDNESTHINGYRDAFPEAQCVHLATDHSLRDIKVGDGIPSIRDFTPFR